MDDLDKYIEQRKKESPMFVKNFDKGYEQFKIGVLFKQAREEAGLTQEQVAKKLCTQKSAISRIENHAEDIRLSTLESFGEAVGKHLSWIRQLNAVFCTNHLGQKELQKSLDALSGCACVFLQPFASKAFAQKSHV